MNRLETGRKLVGMGKEILERLEMFTGLDLLKDLKTIREEEERINVTITTLGLMISTVGLSKSRARTEEAEEMKDMVKELETALRINRFLDLSKRYIVEVVREHEEIDEMMMEMFKGGMFH